MAQNIIVGYRDLVAEAGKDLARVTIDEAIALHGDESVAFVDIRDIRELQREGRIPGAFHAPRGMLEFWIDPESPYHKDFFQQDVRYLFFCAGGMRSVLAAGLAQRMGLSPVADIIGGFGAWKEIGGPVEMPEKSFPGTR
jgi:rhodanese-related sulfurtransferase